ncbi:MAG TPA: DM13 domain-containing protein [Pseudonocardiaceae bacterium]
MPAGAIRRHRRTLLVAAAGVAVIALVVGLWAFQPWKVFTSSTVDEELPELAAAGAPGASGSVSGTDPGASAQPSASSPSAVPSAQPAPATPPPQPPPPPKPAGPVVLGQGDFVSQEHDTSGRALVVSLADGSRVVRLENLATSDGPDLHVWLSDQDAGGNWFKYDDTRHVKLGKLKGTHGNQNYVIPPDVDLAGLRSVVIWCDRFNVSFGSAPVQL